MFVLLCYFLMTYAGIGVAMQCRDTYGRFLAVGIVAIIFCPAILNIAVVTNAVPNSGLPLPFISFGGHQPGLYAGRPGHAHQHPEVFHRRPAQL